MAGCSPNRASAHCPKGLHRRNSLSGMGKARPPMHRSLGSLASVAILVLYAMASAPSCVITKVITEPADAALDGQTEDSGWDAALPDAAGPPDAHHEDAGRDAHSDDSGLDAHILDAGRDAHVDAGRDDASTACPTGWKFCDGECRDISSDPQNCGDCGQDCGPGGYCLGATCQCLPGLIRCDGECVDIASDPRHCGGCGLTCPQNLAHCAHFNCTMQECSQVSGGYEGCGQDESACVRTDDMVRDPLHCDGCDHPCDTSQFCIQSQCVDFTPAPDCASCPCQDCGADRCCMLGGLQLVVCVDGAQCP